MLGVCLGLSANQPLSRNRYKSLHVTTQVAYYFYFYILRKYYQIYKDGVVLDNPYYLQVLHTNEDGVVLGTPIQYSKRDIPLGGSIMRFPL